MNPTPLKALQEPDEPRRPWPDPTPEMLQTPEFERVWQCIKRWDVNVPDVYCGYMGANGNHVRAILDALADPADAPTRTGREQMEMQDYPDFNLPEPDAVEQAASPSSTEKDAGDLAWFRKDRELFVKTFTENGFERFVRYQNSVADAAFGLIQEIQNLRHNLEQQDKQLTEQAAALQALREQFEDVLRELSKLCGLIGADQSGTSDMYLADIRSYIEKQTLESK